MGAGAGGQDIIRCVTCARLYHRFGLSFRDVEDLLAERGVTVKYEAIRQWCLTFGLDYARRLRHRRDRMGDTWYLDEVFVKIQGRLQYLWRAVDEDGDVIDIQCGRCVPVLRCTACLATTMGSCGGGEV